MNTFTFSRVTTFALTLVILYTCTTIISGAPNGVLGTEGGKRDKHFSVDCVSNDLKPIQDLIPNPDSHLNCSFFYNCAPAQAGSGINPTYPVPQPCPEGLFYDFRNCSCGHDQAKCFDKFNDDDQRDFFKCANPYVPSQEEVSEESEEKVPEKVV